MKINQRKKLVEQLFEVGMTERGYLPRSSTDPTYAKEVTEDLILGVNIDCRKLPTELRVELRFCSIFKSLENCIDQLEGRAVCRVGGIAGLADEWSTREVDLNFPDDFYFYKVLDPVYGWYTHRPDYKSFYVSMEETEIRERVKKIFEIIDAYGIPQLSKIKNLEDVVQLINIPRKAVAYLLLGDLDEAADEAKLWMLSLQNSNGPTDMERQFYRNLFDAINEKRKSLFRS